MVGIKFMVLIYTTLVGNIESVAKTRGAVATHLGSDKQISGSGNGYIN